MSDLPQTMAAITRGMEQGLHIGAQIYVSQRGQVVADLGIGEARRGVPMRTDTLMLWLSAGKPITAVAIAQMWERGKLELDDRVAQHLPEFSSGGKEAITIRHILTHTAGFRAVLGHWEDQPWDAVIAALCAARIEPRWIPGVTAGYHGLTSWYILGEIVRRLDGRRAFDQYVREEIFLPCEMEDSWIGIPIERQEAYGERFGLMHDMTQSEKVYPFDTPRIAAQCRPPSNARGPIRELGKFYEMLLSRGTSPSPSGLRRTQSSRRGQGEGELRMTSLGDRPHPNLLPEGEGTGRGIVSPQTVEAFTAHHRVGVYDKTFRHVVDWGLGFICQSNQYGAETVPYGYGPHASPRTFGHSGARSSIGYADPEQGLVVACVFNGVPSEAKHHQRMREMNAAIYEDLGFVPPVNSDTTPAAPASSASDPSPRE